MATVTTCGGFGARENKACQCLNFFFIYLPWSDGTRYHDLTSWMLSFKTAFLLSSFTCIERLFRSSSISAIRVVSSVHLRLLIFLKATVIPDWVSSSPAFYMMYSACKLNEQGDNIQPLRALFWSLNQSVVPCPVLADASWPAYSFLRKQVRWSRSPISWRIFHSLLWSTQWKAFSSIQFSHSVLSNSLRPHEPQHARPPCPSPTPRVYPNSCPLSWWCHPTILSSVDPFSPCPQSFQTSGSFQKGKLFTLRWPIYWSFSFNISPPSEHPGMISFRMDGLDLPAVQGTLKSFLHHSSKAVQNTFQGNTITPPKKQGYKESTEKSIELISKLERWTYIISMSIIYFTLDQNQKVKN